MSTVRRNEEKGNILCDSCKHKDLCKFAASMRDIEKKITPLKPSFTNNPFEFTVKCSYYEERMLVKNLSQSDSKGF